MNSWESWGVMIVGFLLTLIGASAKADKKRNEEQYKALQDKYIYLVERLVKVESKLITEKEVRNVLNDSLLPIIDSVKEMQRDIRTITVEIATLPRREND